MNVNWFSALCVASIIWLVIAKRYILASLIACGMSVIIFYAITRRMAQPFDTVFSFDVQHFASNYDFFAALGAFAALCACVVYLQRTSPMAYSSRICKGALYAVPAVLFFSYFFSLADSVW